MLTSFFAIIPIFSLIVLGFVLRKINMITPEQWRGIELVCFYLLFPALLITTLSNSDLAFGELSTFALAILAMVCTMCLLLFLLRIPLLRLWKVQGPAYTTIFQTSTRWHGFIAFAIINDLFGAQGLAILAVAFAVIIPIVNIINIWILATYANNEKVDFKVVIMTIIKNPLIIGISIGILLNLTNITLPTPIFTGLDLLGRSALGVSLLALGAGISYQALKTSGKEVILASALRLLVTPLVALIFALAFGVKGDVFVVLIVASAVPTAVNGYILARTMGGDAELYAATSSAQVLFSFVSLPIIIWLATQFVG